MEAGGDERSKVKTVHVKTVKQVRCESEVVVAWYGEADWRE